MRLPGPRLFSQGLALFFVAPLFAQTAAPAKPSAQAGPAPQDQQLSQPSSPLSDAAEGRIKLDVVVTNKVDSPWEYGKPVPGLESKDFTLLDDNQPAKILSFSAFYPTAAKPDPPVEVILVIDMINRPSKDVSDDEQHEVEKFLRQNGGHLAQPVSIYRLSDAGLSVTPHPSTDGNALATEIAQKGGLREFSLDQGDLSLQNSSFQNQLIHRQTALSALGSIALIERRKPGRKLLVWVGYGGPVGENSFEWITEFLTRIREARMTLSSVSFWRNPDRRFPYELYLGGVKSALQSSAGNLALQVIATQSGGRALEEPGNDFVEMIGACVQDASAFYTISFDPPRTDQVDVYHDLKVEVSKPGLIARTSTGYYDQPVYYDQPYVAAEHVTVAQLEQALGNSRHSSDAETARQLSTMELTERLSSTRLSSWKARLPGAKSRAALVAVADASVFLGLPAAEIPASAAPDLNAQRLMQSRTIDYLLNTIPKLPDFFATRTTVRYREPPLKDGQTWKTTIGDRSLHLAGSSSATVLYRNGYEVVDAEKGNKSEEGKASLKMKGTFGPILTAALGAARSDLTWSRWEQGTGAPRAVFRYTVPRGNSHLEVTYCCLLDDGNGSGIFQRLPGYHGEIAIDPESGALLRLTVETDLELNLHPNLPILRSDILVEYGPVEIAGNTRICLVRSVSLVRARTIFEMREWGESFRIYGPYETMLDDVAFKDYHMFRGETRILTGVDAN